MMPMFQLCRICGNNSNLIEINSKKDSEKLLICANIKFDVLDKLPKYLCRTCKRSLDISYELRKQSEATEERLKLKLEVECDDEIQYQKDTDQLQEEAAIEIIEDVDEEDEDEGEEFIKITKENGSISFYGKNEVDCSNKAAAAIKIDLENLEHSNEYSHLTINSNNSSHITTGTLKRDQDQEENSLLEPEAVNLITDSESDAESSRDHSYQDGTNTSACTSISANTSSSLNVNTNTNTNTNAYNMFKNLSQQISVNVLDTVVNSEYRVHTVNSPQNNIKHLYECSVCNKAFTSQKSVAAHISSVHKDLFKVLKCTKCNRSYRKRYNLMRHMRKVHEPPTSSSSPPPQPSTSSSSSTTAAAGLAEVAAATTTTPASTTSSTIIQQHLCPLCHQEFQTLDLFKEHILKHCNNEVTYKCSKCFKRFYTFEELRNHETSHETTTAVATKSETASAVASIVTDTKNDLISSFNSSNCHSNDILQLYHCSYCGKISETFEMHTNHMRVHSNGKQYPCKKCNRKFHTITLLLNHKCNASVSEKEQKSHVCNICFTSFIRQYELKLHMEQIHHKNYDDLLQDRQQQIDIKRSICNTDRATSPRIINKNVSIDIKADIGIEEIEKCSLNERKLFNNSNKTTTIEEANSNSIIIESDSECELNDSDNENEFISENIKH